MGLMEGYYSCMGEEGEGREGRGGGGGGWGGGVEGMQLPAADLHCSHRS